MKIREMNMQQLQEYAIKLQIENEELKKKQEAFQDELVGEIQKIEKLPFLKKVFSYGALLKQLVQGVMGAIEKAKAK